MAAPLEQVCAGTRDVLWRWPCFSWWVNKIKLFFWNQSHSFNVRPRMYFVRLSQRRSVISSESKRTGLRNRDVMCFLSSKNFTWTSCFRWLRHSSTSEHYNVPHCIMYLSKFIRCGSFPCLVQCLYDNTIAECTVNKLLMMDRRTVRNM
jgi:hypothetical protein